ncbi:MAG: pyridoxamine 5'-phosphate oxidase family protein [Acidimicrobiales bacterium]
MDLDEIKAECARLSMWAHIATVGRDAKPDVTPVHPCWAGDVMWFMAAENSVKARNIAANPNVALHWQVTAVGDGVEIWGIAQLFTDTSTKRRLWTGVFDYDLSAFVPGGPDNSPGTGFISVAPERAVLLKAYGMGGRATWRKS